jgi:outer membrane immunogenic protein
MKKLVFIAALCVATYSANAADLPVKASVYRAPAVSPAYNWTGFYIGGNIGYGWSEFKPGTVSVYQPISNYLFSFDGTNFSSRGVIGGVQAGYNYQFNNNTLLGLEADFSGADIKGSVYNPGDSTSRSKIDWLATARARAGVVKDRALIYATGGLAVAHIKLTLDDHYPANVPPIITTTDAATYVGWTVGGGVECALSRNWTVKAEYLYMDLGSKEYNFYEPNPPGWPRITGNASLTTNIARVGFNYQFH